jgi:hypothetical protein
MKRAFDIMLTVGAAAWLLSAAIVLTFCDDWTSPGPLWLRIVINFGFAALLADAYGRDLKRHD